ncbi:MAG: COX15/CtaA family protein [Gemmatimonadetes bacterium]|nr:COX15/CtaA family protein [Gemmatimonadota bacterium]GIS78998.1 MAG: cytochrome c oxidase subunit I [Gammaproteobacteria bacterium]
MLHYRAFTVSVFWTLGLLYLGSVVHATESSLACPDWPTCFGTMMPEMTGGVFWEHLHRLVAGGLVLLFGLSTWLAKTPTQDQPWIFRACLAGLGLLIVQSIFGGLTVIYRLPDLISTTHLGLAFIFLALVTVLASATGPLKTFESPLGETANRITILASASAALIFVQSLIGGLVRHMDAGMACPDAPLCLGELVPPLVNSTITLHFTHRLIGIVAALLIIGLSIWILRVSAPKPLRLLGLLAAALVVTQVIIGFVSVLTSLAVIPVSLHTLIAAGLLATLVRLATLARLSPKSISSTSEIRVG